MRGSRCRNEHCQRMCARIGSGDDREQTDLDERSDWLPIISWSGFTAPNRAPICERRTLKRMRRSDVPSTLFLPDKTLQNEGLLDGQRGMS